MQRLARIGYGLERVRMRRHQSHDDVGDELLAQMQGAVFEEVGDLRRLMSGLRPPVLDQRGLEDAIRDRAEAIKHEFGIECVVETNLERRLAPVLRPYCTGCLGSPDQRGEARGDRRSRVGLFRENGTVTLEVDDDGSGFEPAEASIGRDRFGLLAMRERVEMAGGSWLIDSRPGEGTRIRAELPALDVER